MTEPTAAEWLAQQFESLTTEMVVLRPSEWAESHRYLPPSVTPLPGFFSFEVTPYLREIVDCLGFDSPVREVAFQKGVQLGATSGVLENALGYMIGHVKTAPCMMVTADAELAKLRMESHVTPMLQHSDLLDSIRSSDETNRRKTGRTDRKIEWLGGGFLVPLGAQNANKLRSLPIQVLFADEVDAWPLTVGRDGDPVKLVRDRTAAFEASRKILWISTPLVKGQSQIAYQFERGDQRVYQVRCLRCEYPQELRFQHVDTDTGVITGLTWETDGGRLVPESVRYLCQHCAHPHTEPDKEVLLAPSHGAAWVPTAVPVAPDVRSYRLSALYSPAGMQSWAACVRKWLEAWDVEQARPRDVEKLQVFYNNVLGQPFEIRGDKVRFEQVSPHRLGGVYKFGEIPNAYAEQHCTGPIVIVTGAVDVHKDALKVATFGWCRERRGFLIDYLTFEGQTEDIGNPSTWGRLRDFVTAKVYEADDGKRYQVEMVLCDSGFNTDVVYQFCADLPGIVFPVKGVSVSQRSARVPEFSEFVTPGGTVGFGLTVDLLKDRWSAALRREWDGAGVQPPGHFNAPSDVTDKQLRELTAEVKSAKIDKATGKRTGFEWRRVGANELWDLLIYNNGALELIAWKFSQQALRLDFINWPAFWDEAAAGRFLAP